MGLSRIRKESDVARAVARLLEIDSSLIDVLAQVEEVPLRLRAPGYEGLASIIVAQQVSVASARAIWGRVADLVVPMTSAQLLSTDVDELRACGLSRTKFETLTRVAQVEADGEIDYFALADLSEPEARAALCALKGIGPWTAEIFLMFCAGHSDIFPCGDLALQKAVGHALQLADKPSEKELGEITARWAPHRATAARLFWAYFAAMKNREGIAL